MDIGEPLLSQNRTPEDGVGAAAWTGEESERKDLGFGPRFLVRGTCRRELGMRVGLGPQTLVSVSTMTGRYVGFGPQDHSQAERMSLPKEK
ncbi:unnamed protein product [Linum trigynum]|uniref:Uncharacterized protein n=1 Tax=Linum trigynum TaxID=586398 RepID=A0AAV2FUW7_9ROSI